MTSDHPLGRPAELAALYVTGAMTLEERRRFDEHLAAGCTACEEAIRRLDAVAQALGSSGGNAPPVTTGGAADSDRAGAAALQSIQIVRAGESDWHDTPYAGVTMRVLHVDHARGQYTALIRMMPGASCSELHHDDRSQCLVVEGELFVGDHQLRPGDFVYTAQGALHNARAGKQGCLACVIEPLR